VKTAKDYRAMAEECVKWAREARDDDVRAPLLQLGQTWLDAASKLDGLPANRWTAELSSWLWQIGNPKAPAVKREAEEDWGR
jgi:hypothetical protein